MSKHSFSCFKAYDVRGKIGEELTLELVYDIGRALSVYLGAKKVAVGSDIRLTSPEFKAELARGLMEMGTDVIDLGTTGTEEIYFATSFLDLDGGVQITASHNPKDYNGLKIVGKNSIPLSGAAGLAEIRALIEAGDFTPAAQPGKLIEMDVSPSYVSKMLSFINPETLKAGRKLKLLFNIGNGTAGAAVEKIVGALKQVGMNFDYEMLFPEPDGNFPNGIPNPLLPENREVTSKAVVATGADLGIAFDGDFDRCFFFDEKGNFVDGYYVVGLLTEAFLKKDPSSVIVYEPRLIWNTQEIIDRYNAEGHISKTGHSFIKAKLRQVNGIYSGELSAHHYFRDFYFCDSGMIPWLLVVELMLKTGKKMSELVTEMANNYPCSDEINFRVTDSKKVLEALQTTYGSQAKEITNVDGVSFDFGEWRFNVRTSNTEPLLRLNIEARGDRELVKAKVVELTDFIKAQA